MRNLPITLIFVLSASLVVALIYLPVVGGIAGRYSRFLENIAHRLHDTLHISLRLPLLALSVGLMLGAIMVTAINVIIGSVLLFIAFGAVSIAVTALKPNHKKPVGEAGYKRTGFGKFINFIAGNPIMPIVAILFTAGVVAGSGLLYSKFGKGVEFFVETEPERAIAYVRAQGNLSLEEKDRMVRLAEDAIAEVPGVESIFAFAGSGGLNQNNGGSTAPDDAVGQVQVELLPWEDRVGWGPEGDGNYIIDQITARLDEIPGVQFELMQQSMGPASTKPVQLRLSGANWDDLVAATEKVRAKFEETEGLTGVDDTLPLPGIDWQINVDVQQ
ncbi:MAG TPA: efflux RND transporter permease subunit, partial [Paracoccaceae bacterium]|nr:efflux RND transporter permease subunit [Paracoccaceae bacterium]